MNRSAATLGSRAKGDDVVTLPNFLIIGAQKSGTTALYRYLRQHPQIYMPPLGKKEPHFFTYEGGKPNFVGPGLGASAPVTSIEAYRELFRGVSGETAVGEASTSYMYFEKALEGIKRRLPEARLIAVLRNPADRAYSNYLHCLRSYREPLGDFELALAEEGRRIRDNWGPIWHYKQKGFYHGQLERYFDAFGRDRVRVYLYEDLSADPAGVLRDIFRFLSVDEGFAPDVSTRHNVSSVPRSRVLRSALTKLNAVAPTAKLYLPHGLLQYAKGKLIAKPPPLPPETRQRLIGEYSDDILKLQDLIQRDLSIWLG